MPVASKLVGRRLLANISDSIAGKAFAQNALTCWHWGRILYREAQDVRKRKVILFDYRQEQRYSFTHTRYLPD